MRLLILDDDEALTFLMVYLFAAKKISCVVVRSLSELKERRNEALSCDRAILDINLGSCGESGLDVYHWLKSQNFKGGVIFLTGHALSQPPVLAARGLPDVQVIEKSSDVEKLVGLVKEAA